MNDTASSFVGLRMAYRALAGLTAGAVLAVHFLFTIFANAPLNPVGLENNQWISAYVYPVFSQKWSLFSPQPLTENRVLIAQCRLVDPGTGRRAETTWLDLTSATRKLASGHLLTPVHRVLRMHMSPAMAAQPDETSVRLQKAACDDDPRSPACTEPLVAPWMAQRGDDILWRVACGTVRSMVDAKWNIVTMRTRLAAESPVPFSERYTHNFQHPVRYVESGWAPYIRVDGLVTHE